MKLAMGFHKKYKCVSISVFLLLLSFLILMYDPCGIVYGIWGIWLLDMVSRNHVKVSTND